MKLLRRALRIVDDLVLPERRDAGRVEPDAHHEGPEHQRNDRRKNGAWDGNWNGTWQSSTSYATTTRRHRSGRYCLRSEPNSLLKKPVGLCTDGSSASSSQ